MQANGVHTITALKRWSCQDKPLPAVQEIKKIHVYDFDNTRTCSEDAKGCDVSSC